MKRRASTRDALGPDPTPVCFHDRLRDRQAEPDPDTSRSVGLPKAVEQLRKTFARNPGTGVLHREVESRLEQPRMHADSATRRGELDSIANEIRQHS